MAVSKIAVMALVGILAVPILLGYALNLSEVTETEYKPDGESINVTSLLETGTAYTSANADAFKINTDFEYGGTEVLPSYNNQVTYKTSLPGNQTAITLAPNQTVFWRANTFDIGLYVYVGPSTNDITLMEADTSGNVLLWAVGNLVTMHYIPADNVIVYQTRGSASFHYLNDSADYISFKNNGSSDTTIYYTSQTGTTNYIDISGGYKFHNLGTSNLTINLPEKTKSILMSIDLNTITDSDYSIILSVGFVNIYLNKTTVDGVPKWSVVCDTGVIETIADELYYDTSRSSNTYQFYYSLEYAGIYIQPGIPGLTPDRTYYEHNNHVEFRYIGDWPTLIGPANTYLKYEYDKVKRVTYAPVTEFDRLQIYSLNVTPTIRMDGATFSAFAYSIISDTTYTPGDFKTNPTTTLTVQKPGTSFEFAGNTYTVDNTGNITLGTHKVSVNGLKLESIPVPVGYENRINGNVISVTAEPSTIKFNGQWGASVSTIGNTATTYTKTEWTPGEFAWDGIDTNFLIVGLITCLGVFVALGIYVRKSGKGMIPLLIVCGCCAGLFFCMI